MKMIGSIHWNFKVICQNFWRTSHIGNKEGIMDENVGPAAAEKTSPSDASLITTCKIKSPYSWHRRNKRTESTRISTSQKQLKLEKWNNHFSISILTLYERYKLIQEYRVYKMVRIMKHLNWKHLEHLKDLSL